MEKNKNKPEKTFRKGAMSASVWMNVRKNKDGQDFVKRNITLGKVYTGEDGKPANTSSYNIDDVHNAKVVLTAAELYIRDVEPVREA